MRFLSENIEGVRTRMAKGSSRDQKDIAPQYRKMIKNALKILKENNVSFRDFYVFGSVARGDHSIHSDLDLCLILDDSEVDVAKIRQKALICLSLAGIPVDLVAVNRKKFKTDFLSPLLHEIRTYGVRIST